MPGTVDLSTLFAEKIADVYTDGRWQPINGIRLAEVGDGRRFHALTRDGLVLVDPMGGGLIQDNPVEPTHADSIRLVTESWKIVELNLGIRQTDVNKLIDEYKEPTSLRSGF